MPLGIDWPTFDALQGALATLADADEHMAPLMERWADIIVEGNRRGVLQGVDGNGQPMPPLKYRTGQGKRTANRRVPLYGTTTYDATGAGPFASGLGDNLSPGQYRELTGPRLAPRRESSRVIKNLMTEVRHDPTTTTWEAVGAWFQVVTVDGREILPWHFRGDGRNPQYDLRPVRPQDLQFAINALQAHIKSEFLSRF